ncbi:DUF6455 family protein [Rhizobium sp. C4]|uniref:DUF6455 family protein n=1 Tax=Rhizobium sp. C4 TaxID=1349800 RepID=UPI001E59D573|nr:DUF6455 family protein [Rhizobium sp. C4]MCD2171781.1 DUF6455 family protein [Rhizobium sp. C4]
MSILNYFIRVNEHAMLLEAMTAKLGLTAHLEELPDHRNVMKRAGQRCLACSRPHDCADWLEDNDEPEQAPRFCRNRDLFARMRDQMLADQAAQNSL